MPRATRLLRLAAALLLLAPLLASGCGPSASADRGEAKPEPEKRLDTDVAPPGVYELPGGRAQVIGTLVRDDGLEGGFWAISPRTPTMGSDARPVVIANPELFADPPLGSLEGDYVVAEGVLSDGASVRMAGPELVADSLNRIEPPHADEGGGRVLRGVPPRWARIEKPGVHPLPNGSVRVVGVLGIAKSEDASESTSWVVLNEMPFGTGGPAETSAVLTEGPFGNPQDSTWPSRYVGVTGDVVGTVQSGSQRIPVVRVVDVEVVTTQEPTVDEVFD